MQDVWYKSHSKYQRYYGYAAHYSKQRRNSRRVRLLNQLYRNVLDFLKSCLPQAAGVPPANHLPTKGEHNEWQLLQPQHNWPS